MSKEAEMMKVFEDQTEHLRELKRLKCQYQRIVRQYDQTHFEGRIETQEVSQARHELENIESSIEQLEKEHSVQRFRIYGTRERIRR